MILNYIISPASVVLNQVQAVVLVQSRRWQTAPWRGASSQDQRWQFLCWLCCWGTSRYHSCGGSCVWPVRKTGGNCQTGKMVREGQEETHLFPGHLSSEASVSHKALELPFLLSRDPKGGCNWGTGIWPWTLAHLQGTGSVMVGNVLWR